MEKTPFYIRAKNKVVHFKYCAHVSFDRELYHKTPLGTTLRKIKKTLLTDDMIEFRQYIRGTCDIRWTINWGGDRRALSDLSKSHQNCLCLAVAAIRALVERRLLLKVALWNEALRTLHINARSKLTELQIAPFNKASGRVNGGFQRVRLPVWKGACGLRKIHLSSVHTWGGRVCAANAKMKGFPCLLSSACKQTLQFVYL